MASATSFRQILGTSPSTASVKNSTLIIIDAQNEYADGKLKCSNTASSRKVIASLLARYREANSKVVHVLHDTPDGAPVLTPGTKLAEEFEELAPKEGEKVVHKSSPSSFAETGLHEHLGGSGQIVLTGYMVCV
jgi:nicotinamidase-related amidase